MLVVLASSLVAERGGSLPLVSLQPEGHGGAPSRSAKLPDKTIGYCALLPRPAPSCQRPSHLWYPRALPDLKTWNLDSCKKGSKSLMCSGPASRKPPAYVRILARPCV